MRTILNQLVGRLAPVAGALALACLGSAGQLSFTSGSWSGLTGTAAGTPALYQTQSVNPAGASIAVRAAATGSQTLSGTWSFSVEWRPDTVGEIPPANIKVTLRRSGTPTVAGTGVAKIEEIVGSTSTEILKVDSLSLLLSGITKYLADKQITVPLLLQSNGTYVASGSVTSDLLTSTYDSQSSTTVVVEESFSLVGMEGTN